MPTTAKLTVQFLFLYFAGCQLSEEGCDSL